MAFKKIIGTCLCLALVVALAVPVSAVDYQIYQLSDYVYSITTDTTVGIQQINYTFTGITPSYSYGLRDDTGTYTFTYGDSRNVMVRVDVGDDVLYQWIGFYYLGSNGLLDISDIKTGGQITVQYKFAYSYEGRNTATETIVRERGVLGLFDANCNLVDTVTNYDQYRTVPAGIDVDTVFGASFTVTIPDNVRYVRPCITFAGSFPEGTYLYMGCGTGFRLIADVDYIQAQSNTMNKISDTLDQINSGQLVELDKLDQIASSQADAIGRLDTIADNQQITNGKLDTISGNQQVTNDKLDDLQQTIIDQPEQERAEANATGNDSVDQLLDVIPDQSQGFMTAVQGLAASMSYSGIDAVLTIPQVDFPTVGPVQGFVMLAPQQLDFGQFIAMMPDNLLLLVQSLFTIALIVYCFKEFYSTIQYVLTMRGGGDG